MKKVSFQFIYHIVSLILIVATNCFLFFKPTFVYNKTGLFESSTSTYLFKQGYGLFGNYGSIVELMQYMLIALMIIVLILKLLEHRYLTAKFLSDASTILFSIVVMVLMVVTISVVEGTNSDNGLFNLIGSAILSVGVGAIITPWVGVITGIGSMLSSTEVTLTNNVLILLSLSVALFLITVIHLIANIVTMRKAVRLNTTSQKVIATIENTDDTV